MTPSLFIITVLAGWLGGALANLAADRLPDSSIATPNGVWHYVTLPWYAARYGVCPCCGERRPWRVPALEAAGMATFAVTAALAPNLPALLVSWLYVAALLAVLVIDLEHRRVLNIMMAPLAVVALLASALPGQPGLLSALLGGAVGLALFGGLALVGRGALGMGDVKLAGVIGLMLGYPAGIYALVGGIFLAGLTALLLLLTRRATRKSTMAYAPYLVVGAIVALWAGMA